MWIHAPNISCTHGFSDRKGGISQGEFSSLNLGGTDDNEQSILQNRNFALNELGYSIQNLSFLKQVHGTKVNIAKKGQQEGDALVSKEKGLILAVSVADCYPILFHDIKNNVIGAAHAGWRGTVGKIAFEVVKEMENLGAHPSSIKIAIGQGICQKNFEVGDEVIAEFKEAGFPESIISGRTIDLVAANTFILKWANIPTKNIWSMNRCSFEDDFFSYRRDKGKTGRMWGVIAL
ncbi:MAG: peptidoglycan editing factor PgeF [Sphingobacteriaceae bacterium]|nr:peptidoglycan editing factor PgeF [Sphingobacteriaceae bacterium]